MLKNNASKLMKTRYIVEVVPHGNGKNTLKKEDDEEETDFLTNNEQDSSASYSKGIVNGFIILMILH